MEESFETFEEELGPPRADPPPQKSVRQIHRPEMYATRKIREQPRAEPKILPREPSFPRTTSLHKALSIQNMTQIETPWENVTLNRCLFVAITILVLTSGFQRLHETLRGQRTAEQEEEVGLTVRRSGTLRHRGQPPEPETTIWEVMFWWLPDLDDEEEEEEDDDDDDGQVKRVKSKRGTSSSLRNKPLPDKKLMKQSEGKLKGRRAKKARDEEIKVKQEIDKTEEPEEVADEEDKDEGNEEAEPEKNEKLQEKKKKKKQKG
ncbi:general transcription factor IIF subunit 1 isoform X2 [Cottoperca gobio]|uniref:General transcription factor IIF subunit 1 isoform X2 n=1 Tax=Cottoperca gobio TaxID=56716 RepID=A0A6J2RJ30_COTGO|nr:general transcription factor IIF subunit 1-like isoform X2 [Cottoperca gobio]